jgi:glutamate/tyrosine decarboxylase-like PLP-dependent enzyme
LSLFHLLIKTQDSRHLAKTDGYSFTKKRKMSEYKILETAFKNSAGYLEELPDRRVFPGEESLKKLEQLNLPIPETANDPESALEILNTIGAENTVASNGGRYFGFVFGGTLPVSLAANWMVSAWDQNAAFRVSSPVAAHFEKITAGWLLDLLRLPGESAVGFVTGTTMANFCAMVAARHHLYSRMGWDIKKKGLSQAPVLRVIVGEEVHASMQRALMLAGFGLDNLVKVPTDDHGRIIPEHLPELDGSTIVCLQAGNVNTGAIDPVETICRSAKEKGAWVHIDGAFGLWARVSPTMAHLADGCDLADSWAIDLHKWLNVPYDSGLVICKNPRMLADALSVSAAYLPDSTESEPYFYTPEMSRRARGIETWATLYALGRTGVVDLIDRCCHHAQLFASIMKGAGFRILTR